MRMRMMGEEEEEDDDDEEEDEEEEKEEENDSRARVCALVVLDRQATFFSEHPPGRAPGSNNYPSTNPGCVEAPTSMIEVGGFLDFGGPRLRHGWAKLGERVRLDPGRGPWTRFRDRLDPGGIEGGVFLVVVVVVVVAAARPPPPPPPPTSSLSSSSWSSWSSSCPGRRSRPPGARPPGSRLRRPRGRPPGGEGRRKTKFFSERSPGLAPGSSTPGRTQVASRPQPR